MLTVALPKGRMGEKLTRIFQKAGYDTKALNDPGRRLVIESEIDNMRYILVKPTDVSVYVQRGAADIGVAGKDVLEEKSADVYELCDLKTGVCDMCIAAKKGFREDITRPLKVATKYPNTAKRYFASFDREIDIIYLSGSIELAPILNLSDVIVDIVETGSTLRENGLYVLSVISHSSARLIANKASFAFMYDEITQIKKRMMAVL